MDVSSQYRVPAILPSVGSIPVSSSRKLGGFLGLYIAYVCVCVCMCVCMCVCVCVYRYI